MKPGDHVVDTTMRVLPKGRATFLTRNLGTDEIEVRNETGDVVTIRVEVLADAGADSVVITIKRGRT